MNAGIYIIEGGGFTVSGNATVTASGVLIYNAGSKYPSSGGTFGPITLSSNGSIKLTPATTGSYAGVVIIQPAGNTQTLSFSGNSLAGISGTIYAPAAELSESSNAQLDLTLDVDDLSLSGNASAQFAAAGPGHNAGRGLRGTGVAGRQFERAGRQRARCRQPRFGGTRPVRPGDMGCGRPGPAVGSAGCPGGSSDCGPVGAVELTATIEIDQGIRLAGPPQGIALPGLRVTDPTVPLVDSILDELVSELTPGCGLVTESPTAHPGEVVVVLPDAQQIHVRGQEGAALSAQHRPARWPCRIVRPSPIPHRRGWRGLCLSPATAAAARPRRPSGNGLASGGAHKSERAVKRPARINRQPLDRIWSILV